MDIFQIIDLVGVGLILILSAIFGPKIYKAADQLQTFFATITKAFMPDSPGGTNLTKEERDKVFAAFADVLKALKNKEKASE